MLLVWMKLLGNVLLLLSILADRSKSQEVNQNLLVVVPGVKGKSNVLQQIEIIFASQVPQLQLSCLVFTCLDFQFQVRKSFLRYCVVFESYVGTYSDYLKVVIPSMIRTSHFTHVMVLNEYIKLSNSFDLARLMRIMRANNLHVVSPEVVRPWLNSSLASDRDEEGTVAVSLGGGVGHFTEVVELYAAVFTASAWACQWDIIDPGVNPWSVGVEQYFYHCCRSAIQPNLRMGIVHSMQVELSQMLRYGRGARAELTNSSELCRSTYQTHIHHLSATPKQHISLWIEHLRHDRGFEIRKGSKRVNGELIEP